MIGAKETLCTHCGHGFVCSLKKQFLEAQRAVDSIVISVDDDENGAILKLCDSKSFKVELSCIHHIPERRER